MNKTIYLAGAIFNTPDYHASVWREECERLLVGWNVLNPMSRDYRGQEDANVQAIVEGDLADIDASDVVLVNCKRPSWGTAMEIHYAHTRGKRVVGFTDAAKGPISPWLQYHLTEFYLTLTEALVALGVTEFPKKPNPRSRTFGGANARP